MVGLVTVTVVLGRLEEKLRQVPAPAVDAAVVAIVAVANAIAIGAEPETGAREPDALAYLLGVAIAAPLLVRRRWPLGVLLASAAALLTYYALDYPPIGLAVPLGVALFTAAVAGYLWAAAIVVLGLELLAIGVRALGEGESLKDIGADAVTDGALVLAVLLLAEALRTRRAWMAEVRERLRRAEADREREAERRVVMGVGMAAAILVDATVVRMVLVLAVMQLLGRAIWWIPRWLDGVLPRLDGEPAGARVLELEHASS